jgi:hypothetical protein
MTRKDYVRIAEVLREGHASEGLVKSFAQMLKADNPCFDSERFKTACKLST